MKWESEWAEKLEFLENLADQGLEPPALLNRPDCPVWLYSYLRAFHKLSRTRDFSSGGDLLPIKLSEIKAYIDLFGADDIEMFIEIIMSTDVEFLSSRK